MNLIKNFYNIYYFFMKYIYDEDFYEFFILYVNHNYIIIKN